MPRRSYRSPAVPTPIFEPLEGRRLLHGAVDDGGFSLRVNFQPAGAATPAGYLADVGLAFADRGNGAAYGWDADNAAQSRARSNSRSPDARYDTLNHLDYKGLHVWEAAVPDGAYDVRAVAGDPSYTSGDYMLNAEGAPLVRGSTTPASPWLDRTTRVSVTDGRLTVRSAGGSGNKLAFIEINAVHDAADPAGPTATGVPFGAAPVALPGKIEAENFDRGGEGVAYHDTTAANTGGSPYRADAVDVQDDASAGNGHFVGHVAAGESLNYSVTVPAAGSYDLEVRAATNNRGGAFHVEIDGVNATGPLTLSNTGGWQNWTSTRKTGLQLAAGPHVVRLVIDSAVEGGDVGNVDWLKFTAAASTPTPPTPAPVDGSVIDWPTKFDALPDNPQRRFEPYGFTLGGKLYVAGGWQHWTGTLWESSKRADSFDPATNRWTQLGDVKAPETHAGLAVDEAKGDVYFVAGERGPSRGQQIVAEVWKWHPATDVWTRLPVDLPEARTAGEAAIVGRTLHYFGGNPVDRETNVGDHWALDLDHPERGWSRLATQPQSRDHQTAVVLNGQIYAMGGEFGHDILQDQQKILQRYDPATNTWTRLADAPTAKSHTETATFVYRGKIVSAGGQTAGQLSTPQVVQYDPAADRWTVIGTLPWKLQGTVIQPIGDRVYVSTGGLNNAGNPQNATWSGPLSLLASTPAPAPTPAPTAPSQFAASPGAPILVNFQTAGGAVPSGYLPDYGAAYGSRGGGQSYGWVNPATGRPADNSANARDRGRAADQRFDTVNHLNQNGRFAWELAVPNGQYRVRLVAGDPAYFGAGYAIDVEGVAAVRGSTSASAPWLDRTVTVTVKDGKLTVVGQGSSPNKVAFIEVAPAGSTPTPAPTPTPTPAPGVPKSISWASAAAPPISYTESERAVVNGKMYVFGGFNASFRAQKESYAYDPATAKWTRLADLPTRLTQAGVATDGTKIYLAGGYTGNETSTGASAPGQTFGTPVVWVYDTATNAYSKTVPLPTPRAVGGLVRIGRKLHYFGGADLSRKNDAADHWVLDLDRPTQWVRAASMPVATNHFASLEHGGKIYVFGGQKGYDGALTPLATVQIYDPATDRWSLGRDMPEPRSHAEHSTFEYAGRAYVIGGHREHNAARSTVYRYDFAADRWDALNDLPDRRISPTAAVVGGKVLVTGGYDGRVRTNAYLGTFVV